MSWAGADRPLPPKRLPHRLFDRLFGAKDEGWVNRKRSILDAVRSDAKVLRTGLPAEDGSASTSICTSVRDLERAVASLPPEYRAPMPFQPDEDLDFKDWPRIAKIQSDLLAYALATGQTRVASYMLTKCQGLARFPWLGHTCRAPSRLHAQGRQGARRKRRRRPADPPRYLPLARGGVRLSGREAEVDSGRRRNVAGQYCWWCLSMNMPKPARTRPTA